MGRTYDVTRRAEGLRKPMWALLMNGRAQSTTTVMIYTDDRPLCYGLVTSAVVLRNCSRIEVQPKGLKCNIDVAYCQNVNHFREELPQCTQLEHSCQ